MRRVIAFFLFVSVFGTSYAQGPPSLDGLVNSVLAKYGGNALNVTSAQISGSLVQPDGSITPFTVTVHKRSVRFDLTTPKGPFTVIRQDQRGQAIRQTKSGPTREFPDQLPASSSGLNILPVFMLLHFKNDPRFAGSVVQGPDGSVGVKFIEGVPPGFKPPPFPQPKLAVTFWLNASLQIKSVIYADGKTGTVQMDYEYSYAETLAVPFLQPKRVDCRQGSRSIWTAQIASASVNGAISNDFFAIRERN